MKGLSKILSLIIALFSFIFLLLLSVWIVTYKLPNYYKYEFEKYKVYENIGISLDDLLIVNNQMLNYLIDKKESLSDITSTINGKQNVNFFNEREIAHMEDVKELFLSGLRIIFICIILNIILLIILFILSKRKILIYLANGMLLGSVVFLSILLILGFIISTDFTRYFILFHKIFFTNDLWILDPTTDRLINMVPEGFFIDTARNIGILYGIFVIFVLGGSYLIKKSKK